MNEIMISIQPKWCEQIAIGKKTLEVRKTRPKLDVPVKCYIYCTKAKQYFYHGGIGETLDDLYRIPDDAPNDAGKIKYGYSGELMCCHAEYDSSNFLCGKVIGEFVCGEMERLGCNTLFDAPTLYEKSCLTREELVRYAGNNAVFLWHISDLIIYDKPKELGVFGMTRAPQSWCYVKERSEKNGV